jgi:hypothetical protein
MSGHAALRQHLYDRLGIDTHTPMWKDTKQMQAEIAEKVAALEEMVKLAKDRLYMGSIRYGRSTKYEWNSIKSKMNTKWQAYIRTGNVELLVDMINYCGIEFKNRTHPSSHFEALDDKEHG